MSLKGNPVKIRNGPAAVIGDERRNEPLFICSKGEGVVSRENRKSEDLSERGWNTSADQRYLGKFEEEQGIPGSIAIDPGIFFYPIYQLNTVLLTFSGQSPGALPTLLFTH